MRRKSIIVGSNASIGLSILNVGRNVRVGIIAPIEFFKTTRTDLSTPSRHLSRAGAWLQVNSFPKDHLSCNMLEKFLKSSRKSANKGWKDTEILLARM